MKDRPHVEAIIFPTTNKARQTSESFEANLTAHLQDRNVMNVLAVHTLKRTFLDRAGATEFILILARCCATCPQQPSLPGLGGPPGRPIRRNPSRPESA